MKCSIPTCDNDTKTKSACYCPKHYARSRTHGHPLLGGVPNDVVNLGTVTKAGYRMLTVREKGVSRLVFQHRYVMEQHIGRRLTRLESVHHLNGNRLDNRLENLELWSSWHPSGQRIRDLVEWAEAFVREYEKITPTLLESSGTWDYRPNPNPNTPVQS